MKTKTAEQATDKSERRSLMDYLEGEQTINWIIGIIGSDEHARQLFSDLKGYRAAKPERIRELSEWFDSHPSASR
jgi:hypothetical protein